MIRDEMDSFGYPMHQATAGFLVQAASELKTIITNFWWLFVYLIIKRSVIQPHTFILIALGIIIWILVYGFLKFRRITFYIDRSKGEFIYNQGVLSRQSTAIRLERIQQVEINQSIIQKLLKVYAVEVNTAGTEKSEVKIKAMKLKDARQLKALLLEQKETDAQKRNEPLTRADQPEANERGDKIRLSFSTILKIAATSNYGKSLALIVGFFGAIYNTLSDFTNMSGYGKGEMDELMELRLLFNYTWFVVLFLLSIWLLFNILSGIIRFYNYNIRFYNDQFNIHFGLLKTRSTILYVEKVQVARVMSNFLQQRMKLRRLFFQQASSDFHQDKKANIEVPGCTPEQEKEMFSFIFGKIPDKQVVLIPNYRKLLPPIIMYIILPAVVALIWFQKVPYLYLWLIVWSLMVITHAIFAFRNSKLIISEGFIMVQKGAWDVSRSMVETYKIQGISVSQRLWHKKAGIAHITIFTAADNLTFRFVQLDEVNPHINRWLYDAESTSKNWM